MIVIVEYIETTYHDNFRVRKTWRRKDYVLLGFILLWRKSTLVSIHPDYIS